MSRYTLRVNTEYKSDQYPYVVIDEKAGHAIGLFRQLVIGQQFREYMEIKEELLAKFYKDVSSDLDVEFMLKGVAKNE